MWEEKVKKIWEGDKEAIVRDEETRTGDVEKKKHTGRGREEARG